ncbi:MAG: beta-ketoacyl-ACP synthase III [bacterium]
MKRPLASILGTGRCLPETVLTNAELERRIETSDEWIRSRTGIRERRIAGPEQLPSDMATVAARGALKKAGLEAGQLDAIIVATLTPDYPFPATACSVQHKLGATKAFTFDLGAACSGFIYGLAVAEGLIASGTARYILVVGSEKLSAITDWQDRNTCVLFGDGAGAAILGPTGSGGRLASFYLGADGSMVPKLLQPAGGSAQPASARSVEDRQHYLKMDGKEVFKFAVRIMGEASAEAVGRAGWERSDIALFIPHQANLRIIETAAKFMGLPMERVFVNLSSYGNTSAASVAIALDEAQEQGRLKPGDKAVMVAFGAGLTWASCAVEW